MIRFIAGKPGNGKSLYAAWLIILELVYGNRPVVTNLALRMDPWVDGRGKARKGLVRFLEDEYGEGFDARRRVYLLNDTEVKRVYAYRPIVPKLEGEERVVHVIPKDGDGRFRFTSELPGVFQVVDEIHEHFGARDWQLTGREALSWASQHRRAGDDMYAVTQVVNNVEKQLRGVSQECICLVNHGYRMIGMFRQPNLITLRVYSTTPPSPMEQSMRFERLKFQREKVYEIYDTASGVGVAGRKADIGGKAKGLPPWMVIVFIIGAVVGASFLLRGFIGGLKWGANKVLPISMHNSTAVTPPGAKAVLERKRESYAVVTTGESREKMRVTPSLFSAKKEEKPDLVSGLCHGSAGWVVTLSDGTQFRATSVIEAGPELNIDGHIYRRAAASAPSKKGTK